MMSVQQAIERSASYDEIVHLSDCTEEQHTELLLECDEDCSRHEVDGEVEYWGTDEDGATWRVHARAR